MVGFPDWPLPADLQAKKRDIEDERTGKNKFINNDHENYGEKVSKFGRLGLFLGGMTGIYQVFDVKREVTHTGVYRTLLKYAAPLVAMGVVYPTVVKVTADFRKRDDVWNHLLAAYVTGSVWGARQGSMWGSRKNSQLHGILIGSLIAMVTCPIKALEMYGCTFHLKGMSSSWDYSHTNAKEWMGFYHYKQSFVPGEPEHLTEVDQAFRDRTSMS